MNGSDAPGAGYAVSAGSLLRDAREAAGLSMETVAEHLKLAPRQVRAIEEDDYARLPGRTFVRGFVRNYARLLNLDADALVASLPRGESVSPLERLTFTPGLGPMGEMPVDAARRRSAARWLIPLALLAIIGAAAYYEYLRPIIGARFASTDTAAPTPVFPPGGPATTALPNPLEAPATAPAAAGPTASQAPAVSPVTTTPAGAAPATIVLTWSGPSWVEIKDAAGASLLSQTGTAGSSQTISGAAPLEVTIGNAANVGLTFRGQPVDLLPHTRYNVARLSLK